MARRQKEVEARAAAWVIRLGGGELGPEERRRLEGWLSDNPLHEQAFSRAHAAWEELARLRGHSELGLGGGPGGGKSGLRRAAALGLVLLLGGGGGWFFYGNPAVLLAADYRTAPGESKNVTLADGSVVELDTESALAVRFNGAERRVELLRGEAYFTVAPMAGAEHRPFVVESAAGTAKALGTQFMVERQGDGAVVTVVEHKVQVAVRQDEIVLSPGQSVHYDARAGLGPVTQENLAEATAWRQGRLVFDRVRLADMVAALNRYRRTKIVIAGRGLAGRQVSGVVETAQLEAALPGMMRELGVRMVSVPPFVTLLY